MNTEARVVYDEPPPAPLRSSRLLLAEPGLVPGAAALHPAEPAGPFAAGARVMHRDFGAGTVVGMRGSGARASALVRFDDERGPRVIVARYLQPARDAGLASDGEVE